MRLDTLQDKQPQVWAVQLGLVLAMAIWGLNITAVKQLTHSFDATMLASLRMVVASITLTACWLGTRSALWRMSWQQAGSLAVCAFLMVYLNQLLFAQGLQRSTASNAALIMALSPLVSSLFAAWVFQEPLTLKRLAGIALGFAGVAAVVLSRPGAGMSHASLGDAMLVAGVISFALGGVLVQRLSHSVDAVTISWAVYLMGTVMLLAHVGLGDSIVSMATVFPGARQWALVLFSGVLATALCNLLWNRAIARIGVARTSVFLYWVPVFGIVFAALLLNEPLSIWHLFGLFAVLAGTYLGVGQRRPPPRSPS